MTPFEQSQNVEIVSKSFKSRFICVDYLHAVDNPCSHFDANIPGLPVSGVALAAL
jgi:hypothetical protein